MKRDSNIELMRLVLMLFIVVHHGITHGLGLDGFSEWGGVNLINNQQDMLLVSITNSCLIFSVNAFVLISGYFSINFRIDKIFSLLLPVLIYSLLFTTIPAIVNNEYGVAMKSLFFLSRGPYWFILDYLFLMVIAPLLNQGYAALSKEKSLVTIILLLIVNCYFGFVWGDKVNNNGYSLMQFVLMYSIGRYIRTFPIKIPKSKAFLGYLCCSIVNGLLFYFCVKIGSGSFAWKLTYYNNPFVIASSVFFFLYFINVRISSRVVNYLSASALAIYLIQNTSFISKIYYGSIEYCHTQYGNTLISLAWILLLSIIICMTSIGVDKVLSPILNLITHIFVKNVTHKTIN